MDACWLEGRSKRKYSPLFTFQKRLRHLRAIHFRNLIFPPEASEVRLDLHDLDGNLVFSGEPVTAEINPQWTVHFKGSPSSKGAVVKVFGDNELFLEWTVHFSGLVFVSRHVPMLSMNLEEDSMFLSLPEGVYCDKRCFKQCDLGGIKVNVGALCDVRPSIVVESRRLRKSYGVNALNRLSTSERAIRHTAESAQRLESSLQGKIDTITDSRQYRLNSEIEAKRIQCKVLERVLLEQEELLEVDIRRLAKLEEEVSEINERIEQRAAFTEDLKRDLVERRDSHLKLQSESTSLDLLKRRIDLICGLDDYIYPIVQVPNGSNYTICSVLVQSTEEIRDAKRSTDDHMLSTGIAYVFHLVVMISTLSGVPLLYPMKYEKNCPVIVDVNFDSFCRKEFPLWVRGKDRVYFNHAIPLLARNVTHLRIHFGLSSMKGKLMAGLHDLMRFFHEEKETLRSQSSSDVSVRRHPIESSVNDSTNYSTPENRSPETTPTLRKKISSTPNLTMHQSSRNSLELEQGASSDHVS